MATSVVMPQLGESVTEGTVTRWLKQVGERVEADEPLLEVSTDKVDTEIPAPASGYLVAISAGEDDVVEVGGMLATIADSPDAASAPTAPPTDAAASIDLPMTPPAAAPVPEMAPPPMPPPTMPPPAMPAPTPASEVSAPQPPVSGAASEGGAAGSEVRLPELGESVTEGTVTRWLKQVGDDVAVDEPLVEISTDKVDTEIPSPVAGRLLSITVAEDETVEVGGVLAVVGSDDSASPPPAPPTPPAPEPVPPTSPQPKPAEPIAAAASQPPVSPTPTPAAAAPAAAPTAQAAASSGAGYVTPLVRKLAADHGIDLATITGTGVGGRIRRQDVMSAAAATQTPAEPAPPVVDAKAPEPSPLRGTTEKLSRLRRIIAERMVQSLQESAQLTTVVEVDVTRISQLRDQMKESFRQREGVPLTYLPFFAKAVVEALKTYPVLNASIDLDQGTVTYHEAEHLGVAVDTPRGLLVPVIRDAGELNIAGLARRISDLAERTRTNQVTPDELSGGTFTLTNTGSRGALFDTPIINQPQVGILGTGAVVKRPVVVSVDGSDVIAVRSMVYLALTYDHRLVDGADAARFLAAVRSRLEEGAFEGELGP